MQLSLGLQLGLQPGRPAGRRQSASGRSHGAEGASLRVRVARAQGEIEGEASVPAPASEAAALAAEPPAKPAPQASPTPGVGDSLKVRWLMLAKTHSFAATPHQACLACDGVGWLCHAAALRSCAAGVQGYLRKPALCVAPNLCPWHPTHAGFSKVLPDSDLPCCMGQPRRRCSLLLPRPVGTAPLPAVTLQEWTKSISEALSAEGSKLDQQLSAMGKSMGEAVGELGSGLAGRRVCPTWGVGPSLIRPPA